MQNAFILSDVVIGVLCNWLIDIFDYYAESNWLEFNFCYKIDWNFNWESWQKNDFGISNESWLPIDFIWANKNQKRGFNQPQSRKIKVCAM